MKEYKSFNSVPLEKGQQDTPATRLDRWEKANGVKLSSLPENEWVRIVAQTCAMPESEAAEWLGCMRARAVE